ncbi:MAG TPA: amidohydrolase family protein, partial [Edaphobacter sp.]
MAETIDAHHHLWRYSAAEYGWIDETMKMLQRDYLPEHLTREMAAAGVNGAVAVQARQTLEETRWLLNLAGECEAIRGVVGWAPIAAPEFLAALDEFRDKRKLKGLRHVIQAEADENYILREDFNAGMRALEGSGLVYDILIYERHLPQTIEFVDRHPNQVFVLDHVAKPRIREGELDPWASRMRELARRENVWCKVSGMVTEADWNNWSLGTLRPYLDVVVEAFGPKRLMAG